MFKLSFSAGFTAPVWLAIAGIAGIVPITATAQIEEVVVTTRKREESLQDIPIAVSAISSQEIERQGISDLQDVVQNQPSVKFDQAFGPSDNRITIRGLSNTRGRSNVAFLVDGIDVTTENFISAGSGLLANRRLLTDVERIEIVKGPQSALFGRSAFAGAISYVTKEPGPEFEGRVNLDIGDYGRRNVDASFGGPLSDTFGVRVSGVRFSEDGFYSNSISNEEVGGSDGYGTALTGVWTPADAVKVKGRVEYSEENYDPRAVANIKGDKVYTLPQEGKVIVRPFITGDPTTQPNSSGGTNLYNFGTFCPNLFGFDPLNVQGPAGFCLPGEIGDSTGYRVTLSEDPRTGRDYPGTETETFRASLIASFDLGHGIVSSYTGWTDFESSDNYDQDYQASTAVDFNGNGGRPYGTSDPRGGRIDTLLGSQISDTDSTTKQFSQEFRYETQWDGPWRFTGGVLFWQEHRSLNDRNYIAACAPYGRDPDTTSPLFGGTVISNGVVVSDPTTGSLAYVSGICDGTNNTASSWQEYKRQFADPAFSQVWDAKTRHLSFYGLAEWTMTDDLTLTLETRWVDEEFSILKPASSGCTEIGFANGVNATAQWFLNPAQALCDVERVVNNRPPYPIDAATGELTFRYIEGSTYSSYNTPKVTLDWSPVDGTKLYFSYGFAQKPGGINQLAGGGGGTPPDIAAERFDPEKMKAWEFGIKTQFDALGFWQVNSSVFLQDYTDKQVGVQIIGENGISQPRVVNASGAEVWGLEFETIWQPEFVEGLTLGFAGTLLDAEYTNWVDDSRNLVKVAAFNACPVVYKLGDIESSNPADFAGLGVPTSFCRLNYAGNTLERTPDQAYAVSAALQRPFLDTPFEYLVEINGNYEDERFADPENLVKFADYYTFDMRFGLTSDRWDMIAYIDNVLDDDTFKTGGSGPDFGEQVTQLGFTAGFGTTHYFANLPDPRVFGIRASYRFGEGY